MLKKTSPMICFIIFIASQACFASDQTTPSPDYDQIGRFQLAVILLNEQNNSVKPSTKDFIGRTLLGKNWYTALDRYTKNDCTDLSWSAEKLIAARTRAYCDLHRQAQDASRQDVIDRIQHGKIFND